MWATYMFTIVIPHTILPYHHPFDSMQESCQLLLSVEEASGWESIEEPLYMKLHCCDMHTCMHCAMLYHEIIEKLRNSVKRREDCQSYTVKTHVLNADVAHIMSCMNHVNTGLCGLCEGCQRWVIDLRPPSPGTYALSHRTFII